MGDLWLCFLIKQETGCHGYFLRVSYASLTELETLLILKNDIGILAVHDLEGLMSSIKILTVQFNNLIKKLDEKIRNQASLT